MTEKEIQLLKSSTTAHELMLRAQGVRDTIIRTFSEKSPFRSSLLTELADLEQNLLSSSPFILKSIENEIAYAPSPEILAKTVEKYVELIGSSTGKEFHETIERGNIRWSEAIKKRQSEEDERKRIQQDIDLARATVRDAVASAFLSFETYPEGQEAITAGAAIEALLSTEEFQDAVHTKTCLVDDFLQEAKQYVSPSVSSLIDEAAQYFARPNGTLVYMRHPSSPPYAFFGLTQDDNSRPTGVLIRQTGPQIFQAEHASRDRAEYGKMVDGKDRRQVETLTSLNSAIAYINNLGSKHWYTNFIDPTSCLAHAVRFPYPEEKYRTFRSWKDRARERIQDPSGNQYGSQGI
ncbi:MULTISPECIES: hypothetical protein [unclassified Synechococcus]|uniref:hypothetical protein n=1 Tax=unclassified Synechococcus TaxID=2626047 RepID=UPI001C231876|nr:MULTISPECIES: hypothetical protein [unclassified Synechococcus]